MLLQLLAERFSWARIDPFPVSVFGRSASRLKASARRWEPSEGIEALP